MIIIIICLGGDKIIRVSFQLWVMLIGASWPKLKCAGYTHWCVKGPSFDGLTLL